MASLKPITIWTHKSGPNPWKVKIILEELGIPYETIFMDMADLKKEPYETLNPNGRVPTIRDPNNGDLVLWESGAIIEYLVDRYDTSAKLTYTTDPEKYHLKQWLHFQMSGQGPYYGQGMWFSHFHPEMLPSARSRYRDQVKRVLGGLDRYLKGKEYLVGDKCTYADLSFVTWDVILPAIMGDELPDTAKEYPNWHAWNQRLLARPCVAKVVETRKSMN